MSGFTVYLSERILSHSDRVASALAQIRRSDKLVALLRSGKYLFDPLALDGQLRRIERNLETARPAASIAELLAGTSLQAVALTMCGNGDRGVTHYISVGDEFIPRARRADGAGRHLDRTSHVQSMLRIVVGQSEVFVVNLTVAQAVPQP